MKLRKPALFALLLALLLLFPACGSKEAYTPPEWLDGFDFAAESAQVMRLLAHTGADETSMAALKELTSRAAELPYYFYSDAYTGPHEKELTEHARVARQLFQLMLDMQTNTWSWPMVIEQVQKGLDALNATQAPEADQRFLPRFARAPEEDPYYAVLACFFRGKYNWEKKSGSVSITFGGDVTFGQTRGAGAASSFDTAFSKTDGDLGFSLRKLAPYFRNDSISVVNCEGTFTNATEARSEESLRGSPGYAGMFTAGGVEAVSLANEHTLDYFAGGLSDTKQNLTAAGVGFFGGADILVTQADGVSIGFLGYDFTQGTPEDITALLERDIASARQQGALLVIPMFHWGVEYNENVTAEQQRIARLAVDSGADMVVGTHPHVVQAMEVYNGKTIVYSLGDLVLGGEAALRDKGYAILVRQTFQKEGGSFVPQPPTVLAVRVATSNTGNDFMPKPEFGNNSDHITRLIFKLSRPLENGIKQFGSVS